MSQEIGDQTHIQFKDNTTTNTTTNTNNHAEDYRFFDYRLDQLENNLREGQLRIEQEYKASHNQVLETLRVMQENNNTQNRNIIELKEQTKNLEEKVHCIDKLKEVATIHKQRVDNIDRRLEIYKQILFIIGSVAVTSFLTALFELVMK